MDALAFGSDEGEDLETPKKKTNPRPRMVDGRRTKASTVVETVVCHCVSVAQHPSTPETLLPVRAALDERSRLWLHADSLPWLVQYIQAEKESGGVAPVEGADEEGAEPRLHWNFQHSSWVANAQAPDGSRHTLERGIKRRQKAASMTFQEAKALVFQEIAEWADAIENGMLESSVVTEMEP